MHRLREYMRELGETMEQRMKAVEHAVGTMGAWIGACVHCSESGGLCSSILQLSALECQPSDSATTVETGDTGEGGLVSEGRERTETTRGSSDGTATQPDPSHGPGIDHVATPMQVRSAETRPDVPAQEVTATRPSPYDDLSPWDACKAQFKMLADLNGWLNTEKATFLAINFKGSTISALGNLPQRSRSDYAALLAALDSRFWVAHQAELNRARLRSSKRQRGEGLLELAEDTKRLAWLAYTDADPMLEVLGKDHIIVERRQSPPHSADATYYTEGGTGTCAGAEVISVSQPADKTRSEGDTAGKWASTAVESVEGA